MYPLSKALAAVYVDIYQRDVCGFRCYGNSLLFVRCIVGGAIGEKADGVSGEIGWQHLK